MNPSSTASVKGEIIEVQAADLPLSCPPVDGSVVEMHPRVYLPLKPGETVTCPYCSARYKLAD